MSTYSTGRPSTRVNTAAICASDSDTGRWAQVLPVRSRIGQDADGHPREVFSRNGACRPCPYGR